MTQFPSYGLPPVKRAVRRLGITLGATLALIIGVGLYFYVDSCLTPQHVVIVENGNAFPVEVDIAGDKLTVAAGQHTTVRAHDGALHATATGPAGFSESVTLELPTTGFTIRGRTAVYNVGGASHLAVVVATYGPVARPKAPVHLLDHGAALSLLPVGTNTSLDAAFPEQITTKGGGATLTHLCHADVAQRTLGCPNA